VFVIVLAVLTTRVGRVVRQTISIIIHSILTLGLGIRFIIIGRARAAEVIGVIDGSIIVVVDAIVALIGRAQHRRTHGLARVVGRIRFGIARRDGGRVLDHRIAGDRTGHREGHGEGLRLTDCQ